MNKEKTVHESGVLHVTGKAVYIDDMNIPDNTLFGLMVTSTVARATIRSFDLTEAKKTPGVIAVFSYKDIPGHNQMGAVAQDETVLAKDSIDFIGQALFLIAAETQEAAYLAKEKIKLETENLLPVVTIEDSMKMGWKLASTVVMKQGDIQKGFETSTHILEDTITNGAQEHWYLETQVAYAVPGEYNEIKVFSSTQHPSETQALIAEVLGIGRHDVEVETRRLGGAFGGKETQASMEAIWASLLAHHTRRPVKIRLFRDDDQKMTGKRHPFLTSYKIGFDDDGMIHAYEVKFNANAGYSTDLSMAILARARTHAENSYFIPNIHIESTAWKTNLPSNTAFRGFGAPQGIYAIESAIEQIARFLNKDAAEIRYKNFYQIDSKNITPYDEPVENNRLFTIWKQIIKSSDYAVRRKKVDEFNQQHEFTKRGISLIPVKFGISFNTPFLNQAGALVNIYTDGTILVNHGGIEMGQGLYTKMRQVAADELGVDLKKVKVNATTTSKVPNTSATAASSGADMNGMAVKNATDQLKWRMFEFLRDGNGGIKVNTYEDLIFENNHVYNRNYPEEQLQFIDLINQLYLNRISLSAQGYYRTPDLHFDKETQKGRPFHYYAFGMSVSEIELDVLTGKHTILRTDILHDTGLSINPNLDKGQVEGAFIQSVGWCTTEECKWDKNGNLLNHSPDTYKIPGINDIPKIFNVELLENAPNPNTIKQSKAVGEPPFIHGLSVFFAIQYAVSAMQNHCVPVQLSIPATHEKIVLAIKNLKQKSIENKNQTTANSLI